MGRFVAVFMGYSVTGFLSPYRERLRFCSSAMIREPSGLCRGVFLLIKNIDGSLGFEIYDQLSAM